jgi:hypothetical protein
MRPPSNEFTAPPRIQNHLGGCHSINMLLIVATNLLELLLNKTKEQLALPSVFCASCLSNLLSKSARFVFCQIGTSFFLRPVRDKIKVSAHVLRAKVRHGNRNSRSLRWDKHYWSHVCLAHDELSDRVNAMFYQMTKWLE